MPSFLADLFPGLRSDRRLMRELEGRFNAGTLTGDELAQYTAAYDRRMARRMARRDQFFKQMDAMDRTTKSLLERESQAMAAQDAVRAAKFRRAAEDAQRRRENLRLALKQHWQHTKRISERAKRLQAQTSSAAPAAASAPAAAAPKPQEPAATPAQAPAPAASVKPQAAPGSGGFGQFVHDHPYVTATTALLGAGGLAYGAKKLYDMFGGDDDRRSRRRRRRGQKGLGPIEKTGEAAMTIKQAFEAGYHDALAQCGANLKLAQAAAAPAAPAAPAAGGSQALSGIKADIKALVDKMRGVTISTTKATADFAEDALGKVPGKLKPLFDSVRNHPLRYAAGAAGLGALGAAGVGTAIAVGAKRRKARRERLGASKPEKE